MSHYDYHRHMTTSLFSNSVFNLVSFIRPRGVPQVDVTFDIDADGILNVTASEKSSGVEKKITIKNDRDRLSAADIERLVQEAERFRTEDEHVRARSEALTALEGYILQNTHTINTEEVKRLITAEDLKKANEALQGGLTWLEENKANAEKEEFEQRLTALKDILIPIVKSFHHNNGSSSAADASPDYSNSPDSEDAEQK